MSLPAGYMCVKAKLGAFPNRYSGLAWPHITPQKTQILVRARCDEDHPFQPSGHVGGHHNGRAAYRPSPKVTKRRRLDFESDSVTKLSLDKCVRNRHCGRTAG